MDISDDYLQFQQELTETFLAEAFEHLEEIEVQLGVWKESRSKGSIDDVFRRVHSIKGSSGAVNFLRFSESIHVFEDVLKAIAEDNIDITEKLVDDIYRCFDCLSDAVEELSSKGKSNADRQIPSIISAYLGTTSKQPDTVAGDSISSDHNAEKSPSLLEEDNETLLKDRLFSFDRPPKVLLCDDDITFTDMISRVLKKEGLEIEITSSAEAGLEVFDKGHIDFVIADYMMEEMTGIDLLKEIRKSKYPNVPVMIMSGQAGINELAKEMLDFDACYYLEKPVSVNVLRLGVKQAIKFYYTQKALQDLVKDNFRFYLSCRKLAFGKLSGEARLSAEQDVDKSLNRFITLIEKLKKVLAWTI